MKEIAINIQNGKSFHELDVNEKEENRENPEHIWIRLTDGQKTLK